MTAFYDVECDVGCERLMFPISELNNIFGFSDFGGFFNVFCYTVKNVIFANQNYKYV